MWVYVDSIPLDEPGNAEGGADRLPDRVRGRELLACKVGSVVVNVWVPITVRRVKV